MLVLSAFHSLLSQILSLPDLYCAILLTPEGQLVTVAADPEKTRNDALVIAGLSAQGWNEANDAGLTAKNEVVLDSEVGRMLVSAVSLSPDAQQKPHMLLALAAKENVSISELRDKSQAVIAYLAPQINKYPVPASPISSKAASLAQI